MNFLTTFVKTKNLTTQKKTNSASWWSYMQLKARNNASKLIWEISNSRWFFSIIVLTYFCIKLEWWKNWVICIYFHKLKWTMFSCCNIWNCLRYFFSIVNIFIEDILSDDFSNNHINFDLFKFFVANDSETECEFNTMKYETSLEDYCVSTIFSSLERRRSVTFRVFLRDLIIRRGQRVS